MPCIRSTRYTVSFSSGVNQYQLFYTFMLRNLVDPSVPYEQVLKHCYGTRDAGSKHRWELPNVKLLSKVVIAKTYHATECNGTANASI